MCCSEDTANEKLTNARRLRMRLRLKYSMDRTSARAAPCGGGRRWTEPLALHLLHVVRQLEPLAGGLLERPFLRGVVRSSGAELIVRTQPAISVGSCFH